jgi:hypothetical protein
VVRENQSRRDLTKVAQYEVLGSVLKESYPSRPVRRSQDAAFALRATARPQRDGGTKEEREDRTVLAIAERGARPKAEDFYRP